MLLVRRSKRGCWTCRIRKKKCDERTPECSACQKLSILCHPLIQKPDWMDGGEREKEGVARIKHAVKESKARRAALHASQRRENRRKGYAVRSEESPVPLPGESAFPIIPTYADATSDGHMPGLTPDVSSYLDDSSKATTVTPAAALTQPRPNGTPYPGPSAIHDLASLNLVPVI